MFAVSKNHKSTELEVHETNKYFLLHDGDTKYEKWCPTGEELSADEKQAHFGILSGKYLILHNLIALGDDREKLSQRIKSRGDDRIRNPKRLSLTTNSLLFSTLVPYDPQVSTSVKNTKTQLRKDRVNGAHDNAHNLDRGSTKLSEPNAGGALDSGNSTEPNGEVAPNSTGDVNGENSSIVENKCDGENCKMTDFFRSELQAAQQVIKEQRKEIKDLTKSHLKTVEKFSKDLVQADSKKKKSSKSIGHHDHSKSFLENLKGWQGACVLGDEEIGPGMIHFGDGIMIEAKKISSKVEANSLDLRKRITEMIKLIFPDDHLWRSLDVTKVNFDDPLPISATVVTTMTTALDKMFWDHDENLSRSNVGDKLRKVMQYLRSQAKIKSLSPDEQKKLREEKAAKQKAIRLAKKREQPAQKKSNKRAPESSGGSDSEANSEKSSGSQRKKKKGKLDTSESSASSSEDSESEGKK